MRSVTAAAFAICLLVMGPAPIAMGQSPSLSPVPRPTQSADPPGRFVLPIGGYAVTFPDGWDVHVLPATGSEIPVVRAEAPLGAGASETGSGASEAGFCEVKAATPPGGVPTSLIDETAAREVAWFESGTDVPVPVLVESAVIPLAAGYAVRVRTATDDPPSDRSIYHLTDGRILASLLCIAHHGPEDQWLSVAESISFLPPE
jgi:hypothetical protein